MTAPDPDAGMPVHRHLKSVPDAAPSAPTPPTPTPPPRRAPALDHADRPDLMGLVWLMPVITTGCGALTIALGMGALVLAAVLLVALVAAIIWSTGGDR